MISLQVVAATSVKQMMSRDHISALLYCRKAWVMLAVNHAYLPGQQVRALLTRVSSMLLQVLQDFQENPRGAQRHLENPMIYGKLQKLISAGIVRMA